MINGWGSNKQEKGKTSMPVKSPVLIFLTELFSTMLGMGQETMDELSRFYENV
jgi:hypothetical protein